MKPDLQIPRRFTVLQRIEHFVLVVSFSVLGLTGLVQRFASNRAANRIIGLLGGIQTTRVIHRSAAIVFALLSVYHVIAIAHKLFVSRVPMTMLPVLKDVTDGLQSLRYNLFLTREPPKMPRYNFAEKLEYWALIWGGIIMVITGFMLWNPLITAKFRPGQFIPAAKAAHGGEAILAVLAIIVWHFYNVHLKMFNTSMFTGKLTGHQMEEEHGAEYNDLLAGKICSEPSSQAMRRRQLIFIPVAIVAAAVGVGGIYWAATAETTAISTLPVPTSQPVIYSPKVPVSSGPVKSEGVSAPHIPHPIAGQEQCYMCHGKAGIKPMPVNHEGRPAESCRICHKPGSAPKPKESSSPKATEGGPKRIPHPTEAGPYKDCLNCHGAGKLKPFPANHAGYSVESCKACHQ